MAKLPSLLAAGSAGTLCVPGCVTDVIAQRTLPRWLLGHTAAAL